MTHSKLIVLAIGGNSLIRDKEHRDVEDQYQTALATAGAIARLIEQGHRVVITHGNGPQVGFILRRVELAAQELHRVPLDSCGADTQGAIGYQLQKALYNRMRHWEHPKTAVTVITQVLVDAEDPAFQTPTKPIGSFMDEATAMHHRAVDRWNVIEDAGRGWRRVVASPVPRRIIELDAIRALVDQGFVVVAAGGGGIPVVRKPSGELEGAEAVIDKDLATAMLARDLQADVLLISTAVDKVSLNFGQPDQVDLDSMTTAEARRYIEEGHFARGSMLPKVQAMLQFLEEGGTAALISLPENLLEAIEGIKGTRITP